MFIYYEYGELAENITIISVYTLTI